MLKGAEPDERRLCGGADVWAVLVGVDDERRAEVRGERSEGAARLHALLERARVVAEEEVDLAAVGEALEGGPLFCEAHLRTELGVDDGDPIAVRLK